MENKKRPKLIMWFWKAHRWIYRKSGGKIGVETGNLKNLLLTTTGRKSGLPRDIVITYFKIDGKLLIIGSNLGFYRQPAWYLNLIANPNVTVQIGTKAKEMIAREAEGEEREKLFNKVVEIENAYGDYVEKTKRRIPVVVFEAIK